VIKSTSGYERYRDDKIGLSMEEIVRQASETGQGIVII